MFTVNIQKGGAMLDDTRRLIEVWDDSLDTETNVRRIAESNLLGKPSQKRGADVLTRILIPRFVEPAEDVIPALRQLRDDPRAFRDACYYETSRSEQLLAALAEGPLFDWHNAGRIGVSVADVTGWLRSLTGAGQLPEWTDTVHTKVARGLLAALRDFGVLNGAARKEFNPPGMSALGFAYVAFREQAQGASARSLLEGPVWRRWLLDSRWVDDLLRQADHLGVLRYSRTGSAVRIDWRAESLSEVTRVAA